MGPLGATLLLFAVLLTMIGLCFALLIADDADLVTMADGSQVKVRRKRPDRSCVFVGGGDSGGGTGCGDGGGGGCDG